VRAPHAPGDLLARQARGNAQLAQAHTELAAANRGAAGSHPDSNALAHGAQS
jgi:hypothetical protein